MMFKSYFGTNKPLIQCVLDMVEMCRISSIFGIMENGLCNCSGSLAVLYCT